MGATTNRRWKLFDMQGGLCAICRGQMRREIGHLNTVTIDHIIPVSARGSRTNIKNQRGTCFKCNQERGNGEPGSGKTPKRMHVPERQAIAAYAKDGRIVAVFRPSGWTEEEFRHRFRPLLGAVAQLDSASDSESEGSRFESAQSRQDPGSPI